MFYATVRDMHLIKQTVVTALSLVVVAHIVPGIHFTGLVALLLAAVVLGLLNALVRPILVILTLPVTILTLGLFLFVINGFVLYLTAYFVTGFSVSGWLPAIIGSLLIALISSIVNRLV
jgi:putative membrane protein